MSGFVVLRSLQTAAREELSPKATGLVSDRFILVHA